MAGDLRLTRLGRLLHNSFEDAATARSATSTSALALADALFAEAAENDDVISIESAAGYVDDRLDEFGDLVAAETATVIRERVRERLRAWE